jgi:elongation factor P
MLEYNEITLRKYILIDGEPYEVLDSHVFRKQQRKPVNQVKLKNLISGSIKEMTFHVSEKAEEAELSKRQIKYLYSNKGEFWFCEANDPAKRFQIPESMIGTAGKFMKPNSLVDALVFDERFIGVTLPIKVDLKVVEAPPAVRGDTAKGGNKQIKLETGASINAPIFINEGDVIRINTETGEYVERLGGKF